MTIVPRQDQLVSGRDGVWTPGSSSTGSISVLEMSAADVQNAAGRKGPIGFCLAPVAGGDVGEWAWVGRINNVPTG